MSVAEIARDLGVSEMTIRRDLNRLEKEGVALRKHGSAVAVDEVRLQTLATAEPEFETRKRKNTDAKEAIAAVAAKIPKANQAIGLDVGTTTLSLAHELNQRSDLKVFTNSLRAAMVLSNKSMEIFLLGGRIRQVEKSLCGSVTKTQLENFWLDHVFIAASGICEDGVYDYSIEEAEIKKTYIEKGKSVILLCDSSKFGQQSLIRVCGLEQLDRLVTDTAPPDTLRDALDEAKVTVTIA